MSRETAADKGRRYLAEGRAQREEGRMTNAELASDLVRQADDATRHRRRLLVAAVAVGETRSVAAAIRVLREWDGPADIRDDAIELLTALNGQVT